MSDEKEVISEEVIKNPFFRQFAINILTEILANGKTLIAVLLLQIPGITDYPGIVTAIGDASTKFDAQTFANLIVQVLLIIGASHRVTKLVNNVKNNNISTTEIAPVKE